MIKKKESIKHIFFKMNICKIIEKLNKAVEGAKRKNRKKRKKFQKRRIWKKRIKISHLIKINNKI